MEFAKPIVEEEKKRILIFANQSSEQITEIQETKEEEERRIRVMKNRGGNGTKGKCCAPFCGTTHLSLCPFFT